MSHKKKRIIPMLYCAVFFIICLLPAVGMLVWTDQPNYEKRALAERPNLTQDGAFNTEFPAQYEAYFSDHFGFRPYIITANAAVQYYCLGVSANESILAGKQGWLYYASTMDDYYGVNRMSDADLHRLIQTIELMQAYFESKDIPFLFMAAPNKNTVYPQYLPGVVPKGTSPTNLERLTEALGDQPYYLDLAQMFQGLPDDTQYYHKRDSHWNNLGAQKVYAAVMEHLEATSGAFSYDDYSAITPIPEKNWQGDLDQMLFPALNRKDIQYDFGITKTYSSKQPITDLMAMSIQTKSETNEKRAIFYRDSFYNALIDFFSNNLGTAEYTRSVPYQMAMEQGAYDLAVLELAERNLKNIIGATPVFPAVKLQAFPVDFTPSGSLTIKADRSDTLTLLSGQLPESLINDSTRVYLQLKTGTEQAVYQAFLINCDSTLSIEENAAISNGFSLYLEHADFDSAEQISILVMDDLGTALQYDLK